MTTTTHLELTLVEQSQAQKEVTVNQALTRIDAILNTGAVTKTLATPPGSPTEGSVYIVATSPTGDWSGHAGHIAYYNQIWRFIVPNEGMALWVNDENITYVFDGSAWTPPATPAGGGFVNKFRNATFDTWQRGTSGTVTTGNALYTADGWIAGATGATLSWQRTAGRELTAYSLRLTGATSMTASFIRQRLESLLCHSLAGKTITFQAQIYNNTGSSIIPTITVRRAGSADNWSSPVTDINAQNLQACANGAWTQVSYSFAAHANAGDGLEVSVNFGSALNSGTKYVQITEADFRAAPSITTPELRHIGIEDGLNKRYYRRLGGSNNFLVGTGHMYAGTIAEIIHVFEDEMRAAPTITNSSSSIISINSGSNSRTSVSIGWGIVTPKNAYAAVGVSAITAGYGCIAMISSSSEFIAFSAEL